MKFTIAIFTILVLSIPCFAATITVPDDYPNIQAAIDIAIEGDIVEVLDGVYTGIENRELYFNGYSITLRSANGPENCIIDCETFGRGFAIGQGQDGIVIEGFSIINGDNSDGGAMVVATDGSVTVRDCVFEGNTAYDGGAVYCLVGSGLVLEGCKFAGNTADGSGGGLYCNDITSVTISDCDFIGNTAQEDGGGYFHSEYGTVNISNSRFVGNTGSYGGGLCTMWCSDVTIDNCQFNGNVANMSAGGGIFLRMIEYSRFSITNCVVTNNYADNGGGMHIMANWDAFDEYSSGTVANCLIASNIAYEHGGIAFVDERIGIVNCTFVNNESLRDDRGGAIGRAYSPSVINCLFVGNGFDALEGAGDNANHCYFGPDQDLDHFEGINNNQVGDAMLTADHHLQAGSPCIDAGDPNGLYAGQFDIDGEARVTGVTADIGCDEFADSDSDGMGDFWELSFFATLAECVAGDDSDGDSTNNLDEYIAGTNPLGNYYVATDGDDAWDGLASAWDSTHGPKATIQAAINATGNGDTVVVTDGTYTGAGNRDISYYGKAITVKSQNGASNCIIDCQGSYNSNHRGFYLHNDEEQDSVIDGFTIINGYIFEDYNNPYALGGGIYCEMSGPTITNCVIKDCFAYQRGGGIAVLAIDPYTGIMSEVARPALIRNTIVSGNAAGEFYQQGVGGGISLSGASGALIENCTVVGNGASIGGGVEITHNEGFEGAMGEVATIRNCIIRDNRMDEQYGGQVVYAVFNAYRNIPWLDVEYSNIEGGVDGVFGWDNVECTWALGNIDADPNFVAGGQWTDDYYWGSEADWIGGDYHLQSVGWRWDDVSGYWDWDDVTSPCVDTGNPGSPLRDEPSSVDADPLNRFGENVRINMGAYGGTAQASMPPYDWAILSDINNDAVCDIKDLVYFAQYWLDADESIPADFNRDQRVDLADFALLAYDWTEQASWWTHACDFDKDGDVDVDDLITLSNSWLTPYYEYEEVYDPLSSTRLTADLWPALHGDGAVDMRDFAVFAEAWLQ